MFYDLDKILEMPEFKGADVDEVSARLNAIEDLVCRYTHNNFILRHSLIEAESKDGLLCGANKYIFVTDRILIVENGDIDGDGLNALNDNVGRFDVEAVDGGKLKLDKHLYTCDYNRAYKVVYPDAVKMGALNLLKWEQAGGRESLGISSETISRHSVSYVQHTPDNMVEGYPFELMAFLQPYMKMKR